jgi:hypothetical protein
LTIIVSCPNISSAKIVSSSNKEVVLNIGAFLFIKAEGSSEGSLFIIRK